MHTNYTHSRQFHAYVSQQGCHNMIVHIMHRQPKAYCISTHITRTNTYYHCICASTLSTTLHPTSDVCTFVCRSSHSHWTSGQQLHCTGLYNKARTEETQGESVVLLQQSKWVGHLGTVGGHILDSSGCY